MAEIVILPKTGNSVKECVLLQWKKNIGDNVAIDDVLCVVETDKTTMNVLSTAKGIVRHVFYDEGAVVPVLADLVIIASVDEDISTYHIGHTQAVNESQQSTLQSTKEVHVSPRARKYLEQKGWSFEKFTILYPHFLKHIKQHSLTRVEEATIKMFVLQQNRISPVAIEDSGTHFITNNEYSPSGINTPLLQKDLHQQHVHSIEPMNIATKVQDSVSHVTMCVPVAEQSNSLDTVLNEKIDVKANTVKSTELTGARKIIANRMVQSLRDSAQLTLIMSANASAVQKQRKYFKSHNSSITINDMLLYICVQVLIKYPLINSCLEQNCLVEHSEVHLAFTVNGPRGLRIPVLKRAHTQSLIQLSQNVKQLIQKCKEDSIALDELEGGTFTTSNLAPYNVEYFTPVLNMPQTGILGIGTIRPKAMYDKDGVLSFEPHMALSFTFDHQAYDGVQAAEFLQDISFEIAHFSMQDT